MRYSCRHSPLALASGPVTTEAGTLQKETHSHYGAPDTAAHSINLFDSHGSTHSPLPPGASLLQPVPDQTHRYPWAEDKVRVWYQWPETYEAFRRIYGEKHFLSTEDSNVHQEKKTMLNPHMCFADT